MLIYDSRQLGSDAAEGRHEYMICGQAPDAAEGRHKHNVGLRPHLSGVADGRRGKICEINVGLRPHLSGVAEGRRMKKPVKKCGPSATSVRRGRRPAREKPVKKCGPSATSVRRGRRPTREKTSQKMWAFGHICPAWPKAYARKNQSKNVGLRPHLSSVAEGRREKKAIKKCGPSATSVRRGRRPARENLWNKCWPSATSVRRDRSPTRKNMFEIMWDFGHICPAWPVADARKSVE